MENTFCYPINSNVNFLFVVKEAGISLFQVDAKQQVNFVSDLNFVSDSSVNQFGLIADVKKNQSSQVCMQF